MKTKHFDGWGNPILDYFGMLKYYAGDDQSVRVIRRLPPYRYVVIPTTHIIVEPGLELVMRVQIVYPGGSTSVCQNTSIRTVEALRRLYRSNEATWRRFQVSTGIEFVHKGRVIECPWSIYFPVIYGHGR